MNPFHWILSLLRGRPKPVEPANNDLPPSISPFAPFGMALGDVVSHRDSDAWLCSGLILAEELPIAALFVAPDDRREIWIFVPLAPSERPLWLGPADELVLGTGEPPMVLEHAGVTYTRVRRRPCQISAYGTDPPDIGPFAICAEYTGAGDQAALVLMGRKHALAAVGLALDKDRLEVVTPPAQE